MKGVSGVKATGSNFCGCSTYLLWNKRNTTRCGMLIWENNIFGVITVTLLHIYYSVIDSFPITACSIMFYSLHPYSVYIIQYMFCLTVLPRVHDLSKIDYVCWLNWKKTKTNCEYSITKKMNHYQHCPDFFYDGKNLHFFEHYSITQPRIHYSSCSFGSRTVWSIFELTRH